MHLIFRPFSALILGVTLLLASNATSAGETWRDPQSGIVFVKIPKGCFSMGVPTGSFSDQDPGFRARVDATEAPAHEVCLDEFWIGQTEVTEAQWRTIMPARADRPQGNLPATDVSWHDADKLAKVLTQRAQRGWKYRLPTEAEWEYACRAGEPATTEIGAVASLEKIAWFSSRYELKSSSQRYRTPQAAGGRNANAFGLNDMLGNVWEWTQDGYAGDAYRRHELFNPTTLVSSGTRAARGGGIRSDRRWMRCEARTSIDGKSALDIVGFRLVRVPAGER